MAYLWQDIRFACRTLLGPGFAAIVVVTIAVAIGASTAVFSVSAPLRFRSVMLWLSAATALLLPIACANCASLLLAQGTLRRKELAVRAAMGATRMRMVRMILTESVLLALLGGALGVLLAGWAADYLIALAPPGFHAAIGLRELVFALALSLCSGVLFGLAPALEAAGSTGSTLLPSALLAIAQVALAFSLLTGAGLMLERTGDRLRLETALMTVFAIITLLLAMAAVYAVLYRRVGRREKEIGIRIALGARAAEVSRMVLREALLLIGAGSCVGLITGVYASRALLGGLHAADTNILLIVFGILALAAAPASYFPARAASRIEPGTAMKRDSIA